MRRNEPPSRPAPCVCFLDAAGQVGLIVRWPHLHPSGHGAAVGAQRCCANVVPRCLSAPSPLLEARGRAILHESMETGNWQLLWTPASLPYYRSGRAFKEVEVARLTKSLVFSAWRVVGKVLDAGQRGGPTADRPGAWPRQRSKRSSCVPACSPGSPSPGRRP